jgi:hypothetical protein
MPIGAAEKRINKMVTEDYGCVVLIHAGNDIRKKPHGVQGVASSNLVAPTNYLRVLRFRLGYTLGYTFGLRLLLGNPVRIIHRLQSTSAPPVVNSGFEATKDPQTFPKTSIGAEAR